MGDSGGLRLLHVINRLTPSGGAEVSLVQMAALLCQQGVRQALVTLLPNTAPQALRRLEALGVQHFDAGGATLSRSVPGVARAIRAFHPDVVSSSLYESNRAARLAAARTGVPLVSSVVGTPYDPRAVAAAPSPWKLRTVAALEAASTRLLTTHVHALTEAVAHDVGDRYWLPRERITVVPRGRSRQVLGEPGPARRAAARGALGVSDDELVVLNVGRQDRPKGQALLVSAFDQLAAADPRARLLVAGRPGSASEDVAAAVAASPAQDRITLLGLRSDVPDLLCAADVFAFSSLWEGLGGSVLEAMALEVPVVAFAVPAVCEVLDGCGVTTPVGDPVALGAALRDLAADAPRRRALAEQARKRFDAQFELSAVTQRMLELYASVAAAGRRQRTYWRVTRTTGTRDLT